LSDKEWPHTIWARNPDVLAYFRATGPGWQARMDQALREYIANVAN